MSVREEFWVSPWLVSHAENVIRGAYDDCGHFYCYVVDAIYLKLVACRIAKANKCQLYTTYNDN